MRGIAEYKNVHIEAASNEQLVLLCFEATIRRQSQAIEAFGDEDATEAGKHLQRAREILCELAMALDHRHAPELSGNLHNLYTWCVMELARAGRSQDPSPVEKTLEVTRLLYDGFRHAFSGQEVEVAAAQGV